jgi:predicted RNase H-like HicB family nuclease
MRRKIIALDGFPYRIQIEKDLEMGGFVTSCLDMPGCMSDGYTTKEAISNLKLAIADILNASKTSRLSA